MTIDYVGTGTLTGERGRALNCDLLSFQGVPASRGEQDERSQPEHSVRADTGRHAARHHRPGLRDPRAAGPHRVLPADILR